MLRRPVPLGLTLFALMFGVSGTCRADMITLPFGIPRTTYTGPRTLLIPQFDPTDRVLEGVSIDFRPIVSGSVSGVGTGPANAPNGWASEFSGSATLTGPGFGSVQRTFSFTNSGLVFQPGTPVFQAIGPATLTGPPATVADPFAGYIGTGFVPTTVSASYFTDLFWSRSGTMQSTRELGVTGEVTYTFMPTPTQPGVPEPASVGLLLVGLTGAVLVRRRTGSAAR